MFVDIVAGWLDFDYDIQIDITGEKTNKRAEVETGINILQLLAQNPQAMTDERFMKLIRYIAASAGLDPLVIPSGQAPEAQIPTTSDIGTGNLAPQTAVPNQMVNQPQ